MDPKILRRQMAIVLVINGVCLLAGASAFIAHIRTREELYMLAFFGCIAAGLASQVWLIISFAKGTKPK